VFKLPELLYSHTQDGISVKIIIKNANIGKKCAYFSGIEYLS
jgi:hypothetical protein